MFDEEPAKREHFTMRGLAATLGIIQGQPFDPSEPLTAILDAAAVVGEKYAAVTAYNPDDHSPRATRCS